MTASALFVNAALFQVAWFAGVLGAAQGKPWIGPVAALGVVAWHLARARRAAPEALLLVAAVVVGAAFESLLVSAGWLRFDAGALVAGTAPIWMIALWPAFATTLNVSLRLLHRRIVLSGLLGAIAAPIAYYAGARLGAVELVDPRAALLAIGAGWLVITPLLVSLAARLDGYAPQ